jgi:hypothetical protein
MPKEPGCNATDGGPKRGAGAVEEARGAQVQQQEKCCQLAEISAAKHKSGRQKISAAGKICGRISGRFFEKWPKSGRTSSLLAEIDNSIHLRNQLYSYCFAAEAFVK